MSTSLSYSRFAQRDPQTHELPSLIGFWADMHRKKIGEWVNDLVEEDYVSNYLVFY